MPSPAALRERRLRMTKAQLIDEIDTLEQRDAALEIGREEALRERETLFRTFIDNTPAQIYMKDRKGRHVLVNRRVEESIGRPASDIIGKTSADIYPAKLAKKYNEHDKHVLATGEVDAREIDITVADGTVRPHLIVKFPVLDVDGNTSGVGSYATDITDRKRAEEALREHEQLIETILDHMPTPTFLRDLDGRFMLINRCYEDIHQVTKDGVRGKTLHEVFPMDVADDFNTLDPEVIEGRRVLEREETHQLPDGKHILAAVKFPVFDSSGEVIAVGGVDVDITERKKMEAKIVDAREQAEAANQAKSAFLANMSHELRTPMNAIIGYSEMLAEDAEDDENEDALVDLSKITTAGKHLLTLINDVLDLSKIEAGKMELYTEDFDVGETLHDVTSMAMTLIEKKNNALATDYGENLGVMHSDMTKIRQNLFNLISNAAKFTENGTITLSAHCETRDVKDWLVFKVTDTGIGIPEEKLGEIFKEFSQADESTTRHFGGTGLGLTLAQRFTEMMGGRIWAESVPGEGSTFIMELPAEA